MASSRFFTATRPVKWHLCRSNGHGGEIAKLRNDVYCAFSALESEVDIHSDPTIIPAWDGDPFSLVLLEASHKAGLYEVRVNGTIKSDDGNGIFNVVVGWHDPDIGHQDFTSDNILNAGGPTTTVPFTRPIFSDGAEAVTVSLEGFGTQPSQGITLYIQVARIG